MTTRVRRVALGLGLVLALGLLVGAFSADWLGDGSEVVATTAAPSVPAETEPHPLAAGPTAPNIKLVVFERAYSECATTPVNLLASKYKAADKSPAGVAAIVGRAWASFFKAGPDALPDGRGGCLQGLREQ